MWRYQTTGYTPQVAGYAGADSLAAALNGAELVVIPAGVPRKPGMTRDDLFNINAGIVKSLVEGVAQHCPKVGVLASSIHLISSVLWHRVRGALFRATAHCRR